MSELEKTIDLLEEMDDDQLQAIQTVAKILIFKKPEGKWESPLGIKTEEELWAHIDHSLAQAKAGEDRDADDVIEDLMREFAT